MSQEVEIRIQLDKQTFETVRNVLRKEGRYRGREHQVDYYLNNPQEPFYFTHKQGDKDADNYLRVRKTNKKHYLCLKRAHKDPKTRQPLFADDHEVMIEDFEHALDLFKALGYSDVSIVEKKREKFLIDIFAVAIDTVKDLGVFMEVELLYEVPDPAMGYDVIYKFLELIGVKSFKEHPQGYIHMLWNPKCDMSKEVELG